MILRELRKSWTLPILITLLVAGILAMVATASDNTVRAQDVGPAANPTTGWVSPAEEDAGSGGDDDGYESNAEGAFTDGGGDAVDNNSGTGTGLDRTGADKDRHVYKGYQLDDLIPPATTVTIEGIKVRLDWWLGESTDPSTNFIAVELSWDGGTTWTTVNHQTASEPTSESTSEVGADNDDWGRTWTVADLDETNFRVRLTNVSDSASQDFNLDYVAVGISYTASPAEHVYVNDDWADQFLDCGDDPDGSGPAQFFGWDAFTTIQHAIDEGEANQADSRQCPFVWSVATGGTIHVLPGDYDGGNDIEKSLTIMAEEGPWMTTIDGAESYGFRVELDGNEHVTIGGSVEIKTGTATGGDEFTLTDNGVASGVAVHDVVVNLDDWSHSTVEAIPDGDTLVLDGLLGGISNDFRAGDGYRIERHHGFMITGKDAAVWIDQVRIDSSLTLTGNEFTGNFLGAIGLGVEASFEPGNTFQDDVVAGNFINSSTIEFNSHIVVDHNAFLFNTIGLGLLTVQHSSTVRVEDNIFFANGIAVGIAGLREGSTLDVARNAITANEDGIIAGLVEAGSTLTATENHILDQCNLLEVEPLNLFGFCDGIFVYKIINESHFDAQDNIISNNNGAGIEIKEISGDPSGATIQGNIIGEHRGRGQARNGNGDNGIHIATVTEESVVLIGGVGLPDCRAAGPGDGNCVTGNGDDGQDGILIGDYDGVMKDSSVTINENIVGAWMFNGGVEGTNVENSNFELKDSSTSVNFWELGVRVGDTVYNLTDGDSAIITCVGGQDLTSCVAEDYMLGFTGGLTGPGDKDFDNGDTYLVAFHFNGNGGDGIDVNYIDFGSTVTVNGNIVSENGEDGIDIEDIGFCNASDCDPDEYYDEFLVFGASVINVGGNTAGAHQITEAPVVHLLGGNDDDGLEVEDTDFAATVNITGNTNNGNDDDGIDLDDDIGRYGGRFLRCGMNCVVMPGFELFNGPTMNVTGNTVSDNEGEGINVDEVRYWSTVNILDNTITDNDDEGIEFDEEVRFESTVTIQGNTITGNGGEGIDFDETVDTNSTVNILANTVSSNGDEGIDIYEIDGDPTTFNINGNTVDGNGDDGLLIDYIVNGAIVTVGTPQAPNTFSNNNDDGIDFNYVCGSATRVIADSNNVFGNGDADIDHGVEVEETCEPLSADAVGNQATGSDDVADAEEAAGDDEPADDPVAPACGSCDDDGNPAVIIRQNNIDDNFRAGVFLGESTHNVRVVGNTITNNQKGIWIEGHDNKVGFNDILNNGTALSGIHLTSHADGTVIRNNNIVGNSVASGSFGVFNDNTDEKVDARNNYWGAANGPGGVAPGSGDAVNGFVMYDPFLTAELSAAARVDSTNPTIDSVDNVRTLSWINVLPVVGSKGGITKNNVDFEVGPKYGDLGLQGSDTGFPFSRGVAMARTDMNALLMDILDPNALAPLKLTDAVDDLGNRWDGLAQWEKTLFALQHTELVDDDGTFEGQVNLWRLWYAIDILGAYCQDCPLTDIRQTIAMQMLRGDFTVPVTAEDWWGNVTESSATVSIVDMQIPLGLKWNVRSTPLGLKGGQWVGDTSNVLIAYTFDGTANAWTSVGTTLNPLEAVFILADDNAEMGLIWNESPNVIVQRPVTQGWSLVGLAAKDAQVETDQALLSLGDDWLQLTVIGQDLFYEAHGWDWFFEVSDSTDTPANCCDGMTVGAGNWLLMQDDGVLGGFNLPPVRFEIP